MRALFTFSSLSSLSLPLLTLSSLLFLFFPFSASAVIRLSSPNTTSLTNGLVGYWTFDGAVTDWTTGITRDLSGNGNNGSLGLMSTSSSPVAGKIGQAFNFDGATTYVRTSVDSTVTSATFTAWIRRTASENYYSGIMMSRGTNTSGIGFHDVTNDIGYTWNDAVDTYSWDSGLQPPLNQWAFVAVVVTPTNAVAYVLSASGGLQSAVNSVSHAASTINALEIGRDNFNNPNRFFIGQIDDARFYNRALSAAEIKQLYNLGAAKIGHSNTVALSNGLVGYWTFDGNNTSWTKGKTYDLSGRGNDGSLALMSTSSSPTLGKIGQAFNFPTVNYVGVPSSPSLMITGSTTIIMWIYPTVQVNDFPTLLAKHGAVLDYQLGLEITGGSLFLRPCIITLCSGRGSAIPYNAWSYVGMTYDGSYVRTYMNGKLDSTSPVSGQMDTSSSDEVSIATAGGVGNWPYAGRIDDVRIYNRALSATEIQQLYNLGAVKVAHSNAIISDDLVGYWPLDGNTTFWRTGKTNDISGQGNHGSLAFMSTSSSPTLGKIGQAFSFNHNSNYVVVPSTINGSLSGGKISVSAWVRANPGSCANSSNEAIVTEAYLGDGLVTFVLLCGSAVTGETTNKITAAFYGNGWHAVDQSNSITFGTWMHIVGTYDGSTLKLYINGALNNATADTAGLPAGTEDWLIGKRWDNPNYWGGAIDDVRIYNRALSATEIKQLYNAGR